MHIKKMREATAIIFVYWNSSFQQIVEHLSRWPARFWGTSDSSGSHRLQRALQSRLRNRTMSVQCGKRSNRCQVWEGQPRLCCRALQELWEQTRGKHFFFGVLYAFWYSYNRKKHLIVEMQVWCHFCLKSTETLNNFINPLSHIPTKQFHILVGLHIRLLLLGRPTLHPYPTPPQPHLYPLKLNLNSSSVEFFT